MIRVTMMYPQSEGSQFDMAYFLGKHIPLVQNIFKNVGLVRYSVDAGVGGGMPGQPPTYMAITSFVFNSFEDFGAGFGARGGEIVGDMPNYTNVEPLIQVSQIVAGD